MTRKQRNRIYRKMLELYDVNPDYNWDNGEESEGLCTALDKVTGKLNMGAYPELINKKPDEFYIYWWNVFEEEGHTIRVMALLEAIKETE